MRNEEMIADIKKIFWLFIFAFWVNLSQAQPYPRNQQNLKLNIDSVLTISIGTKNLLTYQYQTVYPPKGLDSNYRRSGFIHPVHTLQGQRLTSIQPKDHYHHYGIWNPWTHVLFESDTVDFWNLNKKSGTVRFVEFVDKNETSQSASYTALHHHVVFQKNGTEKIALQEWQTATVHLPEDMNDHYWIDITINLRCATTAPVRLLTYRYGGLGWRATEFWNANNTSVLTSDGKQWDDTDNSRARWCLVQGELPKDHHGGIAILSHPENYNHPEPIRMWDSRSNQGKENVFLNFSPTKDRDWLLEPDHTYILKYRLIVFDGYQDAENINILWDKFSQEK